MARSTPLASSLLCGPDSLCQLFNSVYKWQAAAYVHMSSCLFCSGSLMGSDCTSACFTPNCLFLASIQGCLASHTNKHRAKLKTSKEFLCWRDFNGKIIVYLWLKNNCKFLLNPQNYLAVFFFYYNQSLGKKRGIYWLMKLTVPWIDLEQCFSN